MRRSLSSQLFVRSRPPDLLNSIYYNQSLANRTNWRERERPSMDKLLGRITGLPSSWSGQRRIGRRVLGLKFLQNWPSDNRSILYDAHFSLGASCHCFVRAVTGLTGHTLGTQMNLRDSFRLNSPHSLTDRFALLQGLRRERGSARVRWTGLDGT